MKENINEIYWFSRYVASQADIAVLESFAKAPNDETPHAKRWYSHIKSFSEAARSKLPGQKKLPSIFGAGSNSAPSKAPVADDDDVDLFGSDDEEVITNKIIF